MEKINIKIEITQTFADGTFLTTSNALETSGLEVEHCVDAFKTSLAAAGFHTNTIKSLFADE